MRALGCDFVLGSRAPLPAHMKHGIEPSFAITNEIKCQALSRVWMGTPAGCLDPSRRHWVYIARGWPTGSYKVEGDQGANGSIGVGRESEVSRHHSPTSPLELIWILYISYS